MPTSHTVTTIYNGALDIVSSHPVTLADNRAEVRWLNRNYQHYVRTALRQDLWNFAIEMHELAQTTAPAFRWNYAYALPNGWLRVIPPTYRAVRGGQPIPYEVKSDLLLTNRATDMYVELVMDRQVPGTWDDLFANLIMARLAHGMAHAMTHKASFVQLAKQTALEAYETAQQINAFESPGDEAEQHEIIRARYRS